MDSGLHDQRVLITGASGGIGHALATAFATEGCRLALHCFTGRDRATALANSLPGSHHVAVADLRVEDECDRLFDDVLHALGSLDVLVMNAGVWPPEDVPLHRMEMDQWRATVDGNLTSAFLVCRAFLRHLARVPREAAAIVLVGSTAALFGEAGHGDYAAAKAGLTYGLTRSLKNEIVALAPRGRVNAVCPGWVRTPMTAEAIDDDPTLVHRATATAPLPKIAEVEDVASAAVFLASDHLAGHLTGTILPVAGGMEGRLLRDVPSP